MTPIYRPSGYLKLHPWPMLVVLLLGIGCSTQVDSPPDLDCGDAQNRRFDVLQPDPHRLDQDKDGVGCES
jgi:hypothetical protein